MPALVEQLHTRHIGTVNFESPHEAHDNAAHHNEGCYAVAHLGNEVAQSVELLVERCFHARVNLYRLEHLALFGVVAYGSDLHQAVALHHLGALQHMVGGKGGVGVEVLFVGAFAAERFAGEGRLVDGQRYGCDKVAVGWHFLARVDYYHVAHHHIAACNVCGVAIAYDLNHFVVVHLVENGELLVGLQFKVEGKPRGQEYGYENAHRLEEYLGPFSQTKALIQRNADAQRAGYHEYDDERVGEFLEKLFPEWFLFGWCEHVGAMLGAAFGHLLRGESRDVLLCHVACYKVFVISRLCCKYT